MFEYLEAQSKKMRGKTDLVLYFWSLDRLSREGVLPTLQYLDRLNRLGVAWKSHTEPYLSSLGPFSDAVIAILATLAKQQRLQIVERTKAGLQRAQVDGTRSGKAIGRPRVEFDVEEARSLVSAHGIREAARMLGVKYGTLYLRLNGRKAPKKAISWSDPVWGTVIDGLFVEQDGGEIVIRYDAEGTAWCINHQVKLAECLERHGGA
jgi:DNA invertase Pin-like site-specific DNA recombinase